MSALALQVLDDRLMAARDAMYAGLRLAFPLHSEVEFCRNHTQKNPSRAVVISHTSDGTARVRLSTGTTRDIHWKKVRLVAQA